MNNNYNNNPNNNEEVVYSNSNTFLALFLLVLIGVGIFFAFKYKDFFDLNKKPVNPDDIITVYTITFDANGGKVSPSNRELFKGDTYGVLPIPVRDGYSFDGWYTEKDGGNKVSSNNEAREDRTIYAHWTNNPSGTTQTITYTLYFNANGGKVSPSNKSLKKGENYGSLPTPVRKDYTFDGWYSDVVGGNKVSSSMIIYDDTTIYAHWIKNSTTPPTPPQEQTCVLTFNPNGGTVNPTSKKINKGSIYGELPTPIRDGYTFDGWYEAIDGGERVDSNTIINSDVTIYAHWSKIETPAKTYTLIFDANGGSVDPRSKTLEEGSEYGTLPTPTRSGYKFDGWYTSISGGNKVSEKNIINGNTIIYAHWTKGSVTPPEVTYTLTYNANGGSVSPSNKVLKKGEQYGTLPTPTRSGYKFDGWYTAKDGGSKVSSTTVITANTTIYAHWTKTSTSPPTADSICESVKNKSSIDYASFKELSKQHNNDDYYAIKAAHDCANKYHKKVVVTKATYNIYKHFSGGTITITTDTDFGDSTIYIHDEKNICVNGKRQNDDYIFQIQNGHDSLTTTLSKEITKGSTFYIPDSVKKKLSNMLAPYGETVTGYHVQIKDTNEKRKIFIRSGKNENENNQSLVQESFITDASGKILDNITWTYKGSKVELVIRPISSKKLVIKNGNFKTIVSTKTCSKGYVKRGMNISRSNILLDDLHHSYVNTEKKKVYKINYAYHGFYAFAGLGKVTFSNSTVQGMRNEQDGTGHSTYDLHITKANTMTMNNITMSDKEIDTLINPSTNLIWGVTGTNFTKDITYNNCKLNRIDTHRGVHNLTVKNSTIGHHALTQTGFGTLTISNVTIKHQNHFVGLRGDYGSRWHGTIVFEGNNTIIPDNNSKVYLVTMSPAQNHNYGYDLYMPNVTIKANSTITIKSDTTKFSVFNHNEQYFSTLKVGGGYKLKNYKSGEKPTIKKYGVVKSNKGVLDKYTYD